MLLLGVDYTGRKYEDYLEFVKSNPYILPDDMFQKLFGLLLTDRGSEFAKPKLFEINHQTDKIRSHIFYYDAQMPSQKPMWKQPYIHS